MSIEPNINEHIHTCSFCRSGGVGCPEVLKLMEQADKYEPLLGYLKKFEMTPDEKERLKVEISKEPIYGPNPRNPLDVLKEYIDDLEKRVKSLEQADMKNFVCAVCLKKISDHPSGKGCAE